MPLPTRRRLLVALTSLALLLTGAGGAAASIYGPDVSSYQHPSGYSIGWSSAKASGSSTFAFVKATEGTGYTNPWFSTDYAAMASNGIIRGAYHFADPARAPRRRRRTSSRSPAASTASATCPRCSTSRRPAG